MTVEEQLSGFDQFMMQRQKIEQDLKNASFASNIDSQKKQDVVTWFLSCQSVNFEDIERFYAFISEEVKTANLDDRAFELCRCYRLQAENYFVMAIPNRFHQNISSTPERYMVSATQDACFRETIRKTINLLQLTKAKDGKYIDVLTTNQLKIHSSTPEPKQNGGFWGMFKRKA